MDDYSEYSDDYTEELLAYELEDDEIKSDIDISEKIEEKDEKYQSNFEIFKEEYKHNYMWPFLNKILKSSKISTVDKKQIRKLYFDKEWIFHRIKIFKKKEIEKIKEIEITKREMDLLSKTNNEEKPRNLNLFINCCITLRSLEELNRFYNLVKLNKNNKISDINLKSIIEERINIKKAILFKKIEKNENRYSSLKSLSNLIKKSKMEVNVDKIKEKVKKEIDILQSKIFYEDFLNNKNTKNEEKMLLQEQFYLIPKGSKKVSCGEAYYDQRYINGQSVSDNAYTVYWRNEVDSEPLPKLIYIEQRVSSKTVPEEILHVKKDFVLPGCDHEGSCQNNKNCICSSGAKIYENNRLVLSPHEKIYECNVNCKNCTKDCTNHVISSGSKVSFEIFKTVDKGWGVKTLVDIQKGEFVCQYIGEVITSDEANNRKQYDKEKLSYLFDLAGGENYTIDAKMKGNVSRFINHSCDANLSIYEAFIDNLNENLPLLCMFANRDFDAGTELTINYNYDTINIPKKIFNDTTIECKCRSFNCKKILL
eukprot:TRINITY_DN2762_c0_g1_i4.p1 TRINITY_DN2762_c0_g1~~TRINITY_DN2762_c0_g1_i4.p1  ORF type:complete len:585 (-),score=165.39 TRINITY_DN2762_c0_g1_i4:15-1625(-)